MDQLAQFDQAWRVLDLVAITQLSEIALEFERRLAMADEPTQLDALADDLRLGLAGDFPNLPIS